MSTSAIIRFTTSGPGTDVWIVQHGDGYPDSVNDWLRQALAEDGIRAGDGTTPLQAARAYQAFLNRQAAKVRVRWFGATPEEADAYVARQPEWGEIAFSRPEWRGDYQYRVRLDRSDERPFSLLVETDWDPFAGKVTEMVELTDLPELVGSADLV